ncbi:MAG: hypothetical protein RL434_1970 [Pseudomonadota bacterium]|jgi:hypothetical protein
MKIFLHIGTHKTGTKTVQWFLRDQAEALAREGFLVPQSGTLSTIAGHHRLAWDIVPGPFPQAGAETGGEILKDFLAELAVSDAHTAVVSSEDFHHLVDWPARLKALEQALIAAGHNPEFIMFVRSPDSYAKSLYWQLRMRNGLHWGFWRFVMQAITQGFVDWRGRRYHFDLRRYAQAWRRATSCPLHIYSYEEAAVDDGLVRRFLEIIGAGHTLQVLARDALTRNEGQALMPATVQRLAGILLRRRFSAPSFTSFKTPY